MGISRQAPLAERPGLSRQAGVGDRHVEGDGSCSPADRPCSAETTPRVSISTTGYGHVVVPRLAMEDRIHRARPFFSRGRPRC